MSGPEGPLDLGVARGVGASSEGPPAHGSAWTLQTTPDSSRIVHYEGFHQIFKGVQDPETELTLVE